MKTFAYVSMTLILLCSSLSPAFAAEVAAWTGMGPHLPIASSHKHAAQLREGSIHPSPMGTNIDCSPTPGDNPIILLHGMGSHMYQPYSALGPALAAEGKCVFGIDYGKWEQSLVGQRPHTFGLAPLEDSIAEVSQFIELVKEHTGTKKVDIIGHSEGAAIAVGYAKAVDGEGVGTVVSLAGVLRGTWLWGAHSSELALQGSGSTTRPVVDAILGPAGLDLLSGSPYFTNVLETPVEVQGVRYVAISTIYDQMAHPLENSQFSQGDFRNIVLQAGCEQDRSDHSGIMYSPRAISLVLEAVGIENDVACTARAGHTPEGTGSSHAAADIVGAANAGMQASAILSSGSSTASGL